MWRIDEHRALVATTDFITPLVDDARTWGRVAAANAASDVYAMGGRPLFALNLLGWNSEELSIDVLGEVLAGADEAAADGGWVTAGGHSVDDPEPKFGLVVIGEVDPERMLTNAGLRDGEQLVLTKALGIGVIGTAIKAGVAASEVVGAAVASMTRLNRDAARAAVDAEATGATDVTGFGFLGHLHRLVAESGVDAWIDVGAVPLLPGAQALAEQGMLPGGSRRNLDWVRDALDDGGTDPTAVALLADAQTSGGLLFGAAPAAADRAVATLRASGHDAAVVGRVTAGSGRIRLG